MSDLQPLLVQQQPALYYTQAQIPPQPPITANSYNRYAVTTPSSNFMQTKFPLEYCEAGVFATVVNSKYYPRTFRMSKIGKTALILSSIFSVLLTCASLYLIPTAMGVAVQRNSFSLLVIPAVMLLIMLGNCSFFSMTICSCFKTTASLWPSSTRRVIAIVYEIAALLCSAALAFFIIPYPDCVIYIVFVVILLVIYQMVQILILYEFSTFTSFRQLTVDKYQVPIVHRIMDPKALEFVTRNAKGELYMTTSYQCRAIGHEAFEEDQVDAVYDVQARSLKPDYAAKLGASVVCNDNNSRTQRPAIYIRQSTPEGVTNDLQL